MKTCLISTATNDDAALHSLCPLIGLCHSLHLEAHVIPSNPPPKHKQANPETRLRGWGGMKELRLGRSEGCSSGGEKGAPEADVGVRRSQCVIINKALKKVSTSKHTGGMLSYMKVMHYGLMFPKACYGDAALIWNALCGKWIYRSGERKPGVGADHNLKPDLIGSSKSQWVWIFRIYVQYVCET